MKLLLALSVVFIALSVLAEPSAAEPQESSLADRFRSFGESIKGAFKQVGDKAKEAVDKLHESDFGKKTREVFSDSVKKIKDTFSK
ncbi:hypothetical protein GDO78_011027 [Eleutherodactylus coqui]|uniref:Uncharacterized protein n=1 Tax=Eleutherodactylus coqui TaxID=57060 RepID=A0A8J6F5W1_ELECQ|nr:hypothetical protein GDO78_011027 [Eleutherodactylus coqui]